MFFVTIKIDVLTKNKYDVKSFGKNNGRKSIQIFNESHHH